MDILKRRWKTKVGAERYRAKQPLARHFRVSKDRKSKLFKLKIDWVIKMGTKKGQVRKTARRAYIKKGGTRPAKGTKFNPRTMFKNKYGVSFFKFDDMKWLKWLDINHA